MKIRAFLVVALACTGAWAADAVEDEIVSIEKASWEAWKARDASFYQRFLAEDHVEVHGFGVGDKAAVVATVGSPACVVESFALQDFRFRRLAADAAMLTYRSEQKSTCNGHPVPSPAWITSVYARREGRWVNVLFQATQAR